MGRPPLGKKAMTGAERQRRHWERVLGRGGEFEVTALRQQLAAAKARIAELEAEMRQENKSAAAPQAKPAPAPKVGKRKLSPEEIKARSAKAAKTRAAEKARREAAAKADVAHHKMLKDRARKATALEAKANDRAVTPEEAAAFAAQAAELKARPTGRAGDRFSRPLPASLKEWDARRKR